MNEKLQKLESLIWRRKDYGEIVFDTDLKNQLFTPAEYERFNDWMVGQTVGLVGGVAGIYPSDVERFIKGLPVID